MTILTIFDSLTVMQYAYIGGFVTAVWMLTANRPNDVFSKQPPKWIDEETQQW